MDNQRDAVYALNEQEINPNMKGGGTSESKKQRFRKSIQSPNDEKDNGTRVISIRVPSEMADIIEKLAESFYEQGLIEKPLAAHLIRHNMELLIKVALEKGKEHVAKLIKHEAEEKILLYKKRAIMDAVQKFAEYSSIIDANIKL